LGKELDADELAGREAAMRLGIENPNSTAQIRSLLKLEGVQLTKKTPSGEFSVDEAVLAGLDHPVAKAVLQMRRAGKFKASYVEGTLDVLGTDGRSHPWIRTMQARTGRMSVSRPPLQQLPAGDASIRTMFKADPGMVIGASDYSNVELRVLAALADEKVMKQAFHDGSDLHQMTADAAGVDRKVGKMANFLVVYGGGPTALATQAGISLAVAKRVISGFDRTFPGVKQWAAKTQRMAQANGYAITTGSGRRLVVDRDRVYAATNYVVQSMARDVLAHALLRLDEAGLFGHALMVVHDEVIWQAPRDEAAEVAEAFADVMRFDDFYGVELPVESEVFGSNWGDGYRS